MVCVPWAIIAHQVLGNQCHVTQVDIVPGLALASVRVTVIQDICAYLVLLHQHHLMVPQGAFVLQDFTALLLLLSHLHVFKEHFQTVQDW